jgi:hypothetical protein
MNPHDPPAPVGQTWLLFLFVAGLVLFVIGVARLVQSVGGLARRRRILQTPTTKIADALAEKHGRLEIQGRVVAGDQGVFRAPLSGRPVVWARVSVEATVNTGKAVVSQMVMLRSDSRDFSLDDDSGQTARIAPKDATVDVDPQSFAALPEDRDPATESPAFADLYRLKMPEASLRFFEAVVSPGDFLYAIGPARRDAGLPVLDGYRTVPSTELVLYKSENEQSELLLSTRSESALVGKLLAPAIEGAVLVAIGVVCAVIALAFLDR